MKNVLRPDFKTAIDEVTGVEAVMYAAVKFHPITNKELHYIRPLVSEFATNVKTIRRRIAFAYMNEFMENYRAEGLTPADLSVQQIEMIVMYRRMLKNYGGEVSDVIAHRDALMDALAQKKQLIEAEKAERKRKSAALAQQKRFEAKLMDDILPLTPTKRFDAILEDKSYWVQRQDMLSEHGVLWADVIERELRVVERRASAEKRASEKKAIKLAKIIDGIQRQPLKELGIKASFDDADPKRPVVLEFDDSLLTPNSIVHVRRLKCRAIRTLCKGFVGVSGPGDTTDFRGSPLCWERLVKDEEQLKSDLAAVHALDPALLETLNRKEAAETCGIPQAAFDDAVEAGEIQVAKVEPFNKWGKTLYAKRFHLQDVVVFRDTRDMEAFLQKRAERLSMRRKMAASKAKVTKAHRKKLAEQLNGVDRREIHNITVRTRDLKSGFYLELFRWAQRASRLAKTKPKQSGPAYDCKDDALICLYQNGALNLSFVSAPRFYIVSKCDLHQDRWFDLLELVHCNNCKIGTSHNYSLYALTLKDQPDAGTLHMPYPTGLVAGFPDLSELPVADHDREVSFGRQLDVDETAIFPLKRIQSEVARLTTVLSCQEE